MDWREEGRPFNKYSLCGVVIKEEFLRCPLSILFMECPSYMASLIELESGSPCVNFLFMCGGCYIRILCVG